MRAALLAFSLSTFLASGWVGAQVFPTLPQMPGLPANLQLPQYPNSPAVGTLPTPGYPPANPPQGTNNAPDYSGVQHLYSWPDIRLDKLTDLAVPYLEVFDVPSLRTWQQNRATCQDPKATKTADQCPKFEWAVPFSTVTASQDVGKGLRAAWQRYEDRTYWRVQTELNIASMYLTHCVIDWNLGLNTATPPANTHVPTGSIPAQLNGKINTIASPENNLNLESYFIPLPQVPNADFCDGLSWFDMDFMFIPGGCTYFLGVQVFCLGGGYAATGPGMSPIWFNMGEAEARVQRALQHSYTKYYADYQLDILKELSPGRPGWFFPFPWSSHIPGEGAIIAPVMNFDVSPQPFVQLAQQARNRLGGLAGALSEQYYFQSLYRSPALDLLLLPTTKEALFTPPGAWQLEEFKRTLGPSSLPYYERMGYANFFESWQEFKTTTLPEPTAAKLLRQILFHTAAIDSYCHFGGCSEVANPTSIFVAPHLVPFAGYQARFGWSSVPEGYSIPRVTNLPLFDYAPFIHRENGTPAPVVTTPAYPKSSPAVQRHPLSDHRRSAMITRTKATVHVNDLMYASNLRELLHSGRVTHLVTRSVYRPDLRQILQDAQKRGIVIEEAQE